MLTEGGFRWTWDGHTGEDTAGRFMILEATRNQKLPGAKGISTRSKEAIRNKKLRSGLLAY